MGAGGAGKTHAARALCGAVPFRRLSVRADQPLAELARAFLHGAVPPWVRGTLERLTRRETLPEDELTLALTAALTTAAPVVAWVEDLHEARGARRTLWSLLADGVRRSSGAALLATSLEPWPSFETVEVPPLSGAQVRELVTGALGPLPEAALDWVGGLARGNPLFALEYARFLARHGFLGGDGPRRDWRAPGPGTLPQNVASLIEHALTRAVLSPEATEALRVLAALPSAATGEEAARCAGLTPDGWEAARRELGLAGLVRRGEVVHPLYTQVIRRRLPPGDLLALVRRAAQVLRARPEVAAQLLETHPLPPAEALDLLTRAASHARALGDGRGAAAYTAGMVPLLRGEARVDAALEAARGLRPDDPRAALDLARDAHARAPERPDTGALLAELLTDQNHVEQALEVIGALPAAAGEAALLRARALDAAGDFGGVVREWEAAPPRARERPALRVCAARALVNLGRADEALALLPETGASPQERAAGELVRALALHRRGEVAAALGLADEAVTALRPLGPGRALAAALVGRARLRWGQPDPRPALADAAEAAGVAGALGNGFLYAQAQASRAVALLGGGEYEAAEEALQDGLAAADLAERGESLRAEVRAHLAFLYAEWGWVAGSPRAAQLSLAYAEQLVSRADPPAWAWRGPLAAAHAHARHGDPRRALTLAQHALRLAGEAPGQGHAAAFAEVALGVAHARLNRPGDAERWLEFAAARFTRLGLPGWAERYGLELDAVRGDHTRAGERLGSLPAGGQDHAARVADLLFPDRRETPAPPPPPTTRLLVLGPFALDAGRGPLAFAARRGRALLALLLEARLSGHPDVPQHELQDALYPGQEDAQAVNALQQLVRRVRRALGPEAVERTAQGYTLGAVASDVEDYLQTHDLRLWRGPYLEDVSEGWFPGVRERLDRQLRADLALHADQAPDLAVRALKILLRGDPYNEEHLRFALATLRRLERTRTAREVYAAARTRFLELGEALPEGWEAYLAEPPATRKTAS